MTPHLSFSSIPPILWQGPCLRVGITPLCFFLVTLVLILGFCVKILYYLMYATPLTLDFSFFHSSSHLAARTGMEKVWLGAGSATHRLACASLGSATPYNVLTHCSVSPSAVTILPKWNLLFYSFNKYLSE